MPTPTTLSILAAAAPTDSLAELVARGAYAPNIAGDNTNPGIFGHDAVHFLLALSQQSARGEIAAAAAQAILTRSLRIDERKDGVWGDGGIVPTFEQILAFIEDIREYHRPGVGSAVDMPVDTSTLKGFYDCMVILEEVIREKFGCGIGEMTRDELGAISLGEARELMGEAQRRHIASLGDVDCKAGEVALRRIYNGHIERQSTMPQPSYA